MDAPKCVCGSARRRLSPSSNFGIRTIQRNRCTGIRDPAHIVDKDGVLDYLKGEGIEFGIDEHGPVYTIEEMERLDMPNREYVAKNLFVRDDKKRCYCLIVVRKDKKVDLKDLRTKIGTRPLSFASEDDLARLLRLTKGAVTPFGILNDESRSVRVVMDSDLLSCPLMGVHPNVNTSTVWISPVDMRRIVESHGNPFCTADLR